MIDDKLDLSQDKTIEYLATSFSSFASITSLILVTRLLAKEENSNHFNILSELFHVWKTTIQTEFESKFNDYVEIWERVSKESDKHDDYIKTLFGDDMLKSPEKLKEEFEVALEKYSNMINDSFSNAARSVYSNNQSSSIN